MTTFKQTFQQMFKVKWKWIKVILLIQLVCLIAGSLFLIIKYPHGVNPSSHSFADQFFDFSNNLFAVPVNLSGWLIVIGDPIFLGILCYQNEKINASQTWRLIPLSESKFFNANLLSSFISCVVIAIPQVIVSLILMAIEQKYSSANPIANTFNFANYDASNWLLSILFFLILIALVFFIMTFVSFSNFSSKTIANFIPSSKSKIIKKLVFILLVIIAVYLGFQLNESLTLLGLKQESLYLQQFKDDKVVNNIFIYNLSTIYLFLELAIFSLIFWLSDTFLMKKYFEPKIK